MSPGCRSAARCAGGALVLLLLIALQGCTTPPQTRQLLADPPAALRAPVELEQVRFFPQQAYHCGPAALAMVLSHSGVPVEPDALVPWVYVPERRGSLQVEMLAAARRHGRLAYVLAPELRALLDELRAGHPVLVLQNLGLRWYPKWHYAVAVGFDLGRGELILHSGLERSRRLSLPVFERTWQRADRWAMVALAPGRVPASADELAYLRAAAALERSQAWDAAARAYRAGLQRWPDSMTARLGLGNSAYAAGRLEEAEDAYRALLSVRPDYAPAHNNLAQTLADAGRLHEALKHAERARALGGAHAAEYEATYRSIAGRLPRPAQ